MTKYSGAISGLAIFIIVWQLAVVLADVPKWLLPPPSDILLTLIRDYRLLLSHALYTLAAGLAGLLLAVAFGVLLALAMDYWPALKLRVYPLLVVSQTIPIITIAPLIIIWLGYGLLPKVVVAGLVCFFPLTVSVIGGMQGADPDLVDLMRVMGASRWQVIRLARLPASLPSFFTGLRISATYCIMGAVIGEWLGSSSGLGVVLTRASHSFLMSTVFAAVFAIVALSLILFGLVEILARLSMPWYYRR
jgi:ABC-type nitrate/sulfonate/bicarbonate transport system permease component